jgi:CxxC-x17-CxxC domain-containing protein
LDFEDKKLTCKDCNKEFVWTTGEQKFYQEKGFENAPVRCPDCRKARKQQKFSGSAQEMHEIICKECGQKGEVPFKPKDPSSVLCAECFKKQRQAQSSESTDPVKPAEEKAEEKTEE